MIILKCEHDNAKLKEEKTKAGTVYVCPKCHCVYRLMLAHTDNDCYNKRFPSKALIPLRPKKEKKKK